MQRLFKSLMVTGLLAASPITLAQPAAPLDYMNAQLAIGLVEDLSDPFVLVLTAGKELPNLGRNVAFEVEFTDTITAADRGGSVTVPGFGTVPAGVSLSYWSLGGYGVLNVPLDDRLSARARAGLRLLSAYANGDEERDLGITFGFGLAYRYAANLAFVGEFTYLDEIDNDGGDDIGVNHLSAGVQVRF
ncbi:MAG: porin family protein [Gammaproteobacteria bacterium]|nr:porin family protein [Gammaproteobacteria bacterium]